MMCIKLTYFYTIMQGHALLQLHCLISNANGTLPKPMNLEDSHWEDNGCVTHDVSHWDNLLSQ